jgi:FHA domain-containing protein
MPAAASGLDNSPRRPDIMGMTNPNDSSEKLARTVDGSERPSPFGSPYVFVLVVMDGEDVTAVHRIVRTETLLGRGEENHFVLQDEEISKVHCKIRTEGPVCKIVDPGSRNGTTVNGRLLAPNVAQRLRNLDEIEIGGHRLLFLSGRSRAPVRNAA